MSRGENGRPKLGKRTVPKVNGPSNWTLQSIEDGLDLKWSICWWKVDGQNIGECSKSIVNGPKNQLWLGLGKWKWTVLKDQNWTV